MIKNKYEKKYENKYGYNKINNILIDRIEEMRYNRYIIKDKNKIKYILSILLIDLLNDANSEKYFSSLRILKMINILFIT